MKTPVDNTALAPGATVALLNSGVDFDMVDLWRIKLSGGTMLRWSGGDQPVPFNGNTWSLGPVIDRGKISTKLGAEVATLDMHISAGPTDLINGVPLLIYLRGNGLDGASINLWTAYSPDLTARPPVFTGVTLEFSGRVTSIKNLTRTDADITVSSWLVLLNTKADPNLFQSPCLNTLYDSNCTMLPTGTNLATNLVVTGAPTTTQFSATPASPDDRFTQGIISFNTGPNAGLQRSVSKYAGGVFIMALPFPAPPNVGDTFNANDGCDLTMNRCQNHFNNLIHFRGMPFIPPPETLL